MPLKPHPAKRRRYPVATVLILLLVVGLIGYGLFRINTGEDPNTHQEIPSDSNSFDRGQRSLQAPGSLWVIVNKQRPLPEEYVPKQLITPDIPLRLEHSSEEMRVDERIAGPLQRLITAAQADGLELVLGSGYRSYDTQALTYESFVAQEGQTAADRYSARPGHSEHQTGLVADLVRPDEECAFETCFGELPEGQWLSEHAHEYGFIIRYPENGQAVTGFQYEPWHFRYVGEELARELHRRGNPPLEEFFDLPPAPQY